MVNTSELDLECVAFLRVQAEMQEWISELTERCTAVESALKKNNTLLRKAIARADKMLFNLECQNNQQSVKLVHSKRITK